MAKKAIVTASTKGIGRAIGIELLKKGYFVCFNYSSDENGAKALINELDGDFIDSYCIIKADLSTYDGMEYFVLKVIDRFGTIDCLILNVAITDKTKFGEITPENWNKVMDTNLSIPFFLIQKFSNHINNDGRIIMIGALLGQVPHATSLSYAVSKAGFNFLAKCLVKEFYGRKITVNAILPGFVDTPWQLNKAPEHRKRIENKISLKRFAHAKEIAQLCSSIIENPYINGSNINIDGGYDYC